MVFSHEQRMRIEEVKRNLNRVSDREVIDRLVEMIYAMNEKLEEKKARDYGNGEYVRELQELNRAYEKRLGYY